MTNQTPATPQIMKLHAYRQKVHKQIVSGEKKRYNFQKIDES